MRIRTCLLLSIAILAIGAPGRAAAPGPRFAATTTITSQRSRAVSVVLPRAVTINTQNPASWISVTMSGGFGGVLLDDVGHRGSAARTGFLYVRLAPPAGCDPVGPCKPVELVSVRRGTDQTFRPPTGPLTLQPGNYRAYVIGGSNSNRLTLKLNGLSGSAAFAAVRPIDLHYQSENLSPLDRIEAHPEDASGRAYDFVAWRGLSIGNVPSGPALLAAAVWRSSGPAGTPDSPSALNSCWSRGNNGNSLPDYWWQDPAVVMDHYIPKTTVCADEAQTQLRAERSYARVTGPGEWGFTYEVNPVVVRGQRRGAFALSIPLLDAQS